MDGKGGGMIRATMAVWLVLVLAASGGLYYVKYRVQHLEQQLRTLNQAVVREQEAIHVLKAEWSYVNRPEKLADLVEHHLRLGPVPGAQVGTIDSLSYRLPAMVDGGMQTAETAIQVPKAGAQETGR